MKPCLDAIAEYIREDLPELEKDHRQDKDQILQDLRWCFKAYWYLAVPKMDMKLCH